MSFRKVTIIVRVSALEAVEQALVEARVKGVTVTRVKGFGEYKNFYTRDFLSAHVRLEVFTHRERVDAIVQAVCRAASTGREGDGLIAVLPVEQVYRIRDHACADPGNPDDL